MKKLIVSFVALVAVSQLRAAIVLNEPFNYANGNLVGALGSPWANHSGTASFIQVTNEMIRIVHGSGSREDANAPLANAPYDTNSGAILYASFDVTFTSLPSTNGAYFAHFRDLGIGFRGRVWASATNAEPGKFRLSAGNSSLGNPSTGQYPLDLSTGVTYKVVTRLEVGSALTTLWIDPLTEGDFNVLGTDAATGTAAPVPISTYGFRQDNGGGVCLIDSLKVGTTFGDVTGANNPPTISAIPAQRIPAGYSTGPLAFTVSDVETPAAGLTVDGSSSNESLIPDANIVVSGTGTSRTVTVTPAPGQEGTAVITLTVTDGDGASSPTTFPISVGLPTLSDIPNQIIVTNSSTGPIVFTISDAETPSGSLNVSASSSNTNLVPAGGIQLGGSGPARTISVTPAADSAGFTTITVTLTDGTHSVTDTFTVTVRPILGLLISEPFDYPDGSAIAGGATSWINHSGPFGQTTVNGGRLSLIQTNDEDFNREFFPQVFAPTSGVVLYASFTANFSGLPSTAGGYFAHYKDDGTLNFRARVFATRATAPDGALRFGIALNAASVNTNQLHPNAIATNTTHTIVTRYDVGTGNCALWVDPTGEDDTHVVATDTSGAITVYSFAFRQTTGIGVMAIDDLKIGTSFSDVAEIRYALSILGADDDVQISWPKAARDAGYKLQENTGLDPADWSDVSTDLVSEQGDRLVVRFFDVTGNRYFRLIK